MRFVGLLILLPILSFGNSGSPVRPVNPIVNHYLSSFTSLEKPQLANIEAYVKTFSRLEAKRTLFTSDADYLKYIFQKIHLLYKITRCHVLCFIILLYKLNILIPSK